MMTASNPVAEEMKRLADEYLASSRLLYKDYIHSAMLTLSFSAEVYIKLILYTMQIDYKREHNLKNLFSLLPADTYELIGKRLFFDKHSVQSVVTIWCEDPVEALDKVLSLYSKEFTDERYTYEIRELKKAEKCSSIMKKRPIIDAGTLLCLVESLKMYYEAVCNAKEEHHGQ